MTSALYLDTEFNGFKDGKLISMGLISTCGDSWYHVYNIPQNTTQWIKENVLLRLCKDVDPPRVFRLSLWDFLIKHEGKPIIANCSIDFKHLTEMLIEENGIKLNIELDMHLIRSKTLKARIPHNALSDAEALMHWHVSQ